MQNKITLILPFIITALIFIASNLVVAYTPLRSYLDDLMPQHFDYKFKQLQEDDPKKIDFLVMGSSKSNLGFMTETFEKQSPYPTNAYNFGLNGNNKYFTYQLMLEYLIKNQVKPKFIVLEASDFLFADLGGPEFQDIIYNVSLVEKDSGICKTLIETSIVSSEKKWKILTSWLIPMYAYRNVLSPQFILDQIHGILSGKSHEMDMPIQGWTTLKKNSPFETIDVNNFKAKTPSKPVVQFNTKELRSLLDFCNEQNIKVVLVEWPTYRPDQNQSGEQLSSFHKAVRSIAQTYQLSYINLNDNGTMNSNPRYFADEIHLNRYGAALYTELLTRQLLTPAEVAGKVPLR